MHVPEGIRILDCLVSHNAAGTEDISEIFIKSGDAKTLYLEFIPSYNVETGEYNLVSIVESSTMRMNRI